MERRQADVKRRKGRTAAIIAAALLVLSGIGLYAYMTYSPISRGSRQLLNDTAGILEESKSVKEVVPISKDTRKLMTVGTLVMQNPDFVSGGAAAFTPISIGSEEQEKIVKTLKENWPEERPPWNNGYAGRCESWVCEVYKEADMPARGSCCAASSRDDLAKDSGDIPVGAMIYSGPDCRAGTICEICGKDPGHVAIYLGDGMVAGSQSQYIMTFDEFRVIFGYGGWSFSGNVYE